MVWLYTNYAYSGTHGVREYKTLLIENGYQSVVDQLDNYIPIENNLGGGTILSHIDEGKYQDGSPEYRYINGIEYPSIRSSIITGLLDDKSFLTRISLGLLQDQGYNVNYDSPYLMNTSTALIIIYSLFGTENTIAQTAITNSTSQLS